MQRNAFPPAHSPPLHHPVPQHVSTVPQLRSPPPPVPPSSQPQQAGYGYAGATFGQAPFGAFINENTAQMGLNVANKYVEQNFGRYVDMKSWKGYFDVSSRSVLNKLIIVLFPYTHKPWSRKEGQSSFGAQEGRFYLPPRDDINSPDMYIPVMGLITYVIVCTLLAGLKGAFDPALLGSILTWASLIILCEIGIIRLAIYFLDITSESSLKDLLAYSGYKFVGINVSMILAEIWNRGGGTGGWFGNTVFLYTYLANAFFLLRSLRYVLLPDSPANAPSGVSYTSGRSERSKKQSRTYFLAGYSYIAQLFFMWVLTRNI